MSMVDEAPAEATATTSKSDTLFDAVGTIASLALRFALGIPFFLSGLTKWNGFLQLSPSVDFLFKEEFKLHIFGAVYPFPFPEVAGPLAATAEIVLPIMLFLGIATRVAALGLLGMAGVIFLVYPATWAGEQLPWAAMALALMAYGPGKISVDHLVGRRTR